MVKKTIVVLSIIVMNLVIFALSKVPSAEAVTNDGNLQALFRTQPDPVDDRQSQIIEKRYREYCREFKKIIFSLSKEAEKMGIQATQEEISVQEKAFKAMFPGTPFLRFNLCNEILARKYAKTIPGAFVSTGNIHDAYIQLQLEYSNEAMPSLADVQPMLELILLMGNGAVQIEAEKYNEQFQKEYNEKQIKSSETWAISDMKIHAPDNVCLARLNYNDSCLLTVEKFNRYIRYMEFKKSFSIERARRGAIKEILRDLYIADEVRKQQTGESDTTMARAMQDWRQKRMFKMKYKDLGTPVRDLNSLHDAFSTYYEALFSECGFPCFSIIGSSDSLYMDSILQALKCATSKNDRNGDNESKTIYRPSGFHWSCSHAGFLPEEFNKYTDTMHVKDVSGIIKMPYGFFIVRFDSMRIQPAQRFEDVQDDLIFLATKRKWKNLDSLLEAEAYRLYASNKRLNKTPDTIRVMSFLTPAIDRAADSAGGKSSMKSTAPKCLEKGLAVVSTQLPFDIRDSLLNRFDAGKDKKQILGPVASRYGIWNFKVLDIHPGGRRLPFSFSKKRLIDSMVVRELEFPHYAQWQKPDSVLNNIALAKSYNPVPLVFKGIGKDGPFNPAERKKTESRTAEMRAWFSKISILYVTDNQEDSSIFSERVGQGAEDK